jgi:four helix bundle protein
MRDGSTRQGFRDLIGWQKAVKLTVAIYEVTRGWPRDEQFGLTSQVRRAVVSVPANIAEGHGRTGPNEFLHHLSIAFGSLCEVETHLVLAEHLGYLPANAAQDLFDLLTELRRIVQGLIRSLRRSAT